jgi:hypothetical protein
MVTHMKTTIDIPNDLFMEIKRIAEGRGTTFGAVVESALQQVASAERQPQQPFRLRKHVFHGQGLQPGVSEGDWEEIRSRAYEGQGV